jgi:diaminohydroxyphosphoribosylaminopyrimidine deaminase/5-amino-6-(5-phosphoribosylamino)uracil reductase
VQGARQPWRVVLSRSGRLPADAQIFTDRFAERTLVYRGQELGAVLEDLGRREITSVLLEGGGDILGQAVDARLIDKVRIYVGSTFIGGPVVAFAGSGAACTAEGIALQDVAYERLASDVLVTANARYDARPSE